LTAYTSIKPTKDKDGGSTPNKADILSELIILPYLELDPAILSKNYIVKNHMNCVEKDLYDCRIGFDLSFHATILHGT